MYLAIHLSYLSIIIIIIKGKKAIDLRGFLSEVRGMGAVGGRGPVIALVMEFIPAIETLTACLSKCSIAVETR